MRTSMRLCALLLGFMMLASVAYATGRLTVKRTTVVAGGGHGDPLMDKLAALPSRPEWGPLPIVTGQLAQIPTLHKMLESGDADSRARSAFLIGQIGSPDSLPVLVKALHDPDRKVRVFSGIGLACMGDPRGVPLCDSAMKTDPDWVKYYAVYGLWRVNTPEAQTVLKRKYENLGPLVTTALKGALHTPTVALPKTALKPGDIKDVKQLQPDDLWMQTANAYTRESDWWWHNGDFEQVARCLHSSLLFDPQNTENYSNIAYLQWSLGRTDEAVGTLQSGVAAAPDDPESHYFLGEFLFRLKRYSEAEPILKKSVDLGGDDRLARRVYAHCLEQLGKLDDALAQWKILVDTDTKATDGAAKVNYARVKSLIDSKKSD